MYGSKHEEEFKGVQRWFSFSEGRRARELVDSREAEGWAMADGQFSVKNKNKWEYGKLLETPTWPWFKYLWGRESGGQQNKVQRSTNTYALFVLGWCKRKI